MNSDAAAGIRAVALPLSGSPLTAAALDGTAGAWYAAAPSTANEWRERCRDTARGDDGWLRALDPALGSGASLLERVGKGGVVVTTGQQPGLFGGPLYTLHKALSARELAREIERETGIPAAPVFWAATDDADFREAATTTVAMTDGPLRLTLDGAPPEGVPLQQVQLGTDVTALAEQLRSACGSASDPRALEAALAFRPGVTIGDAYVEMLRQLFEPLGIAVLDAAHAAVGNATRAFLERALERGRDVQEALRVRQDAITAAGFEAQVDTDRDLSLVFEWVRGSDGLDRKRRLGIGEAAGNARLSPNVLLRPVTERTLLPTVAYVGGPGEVAYFAQVSAVADALDAPCPLILPRWTGTLVPHDVDEQLEQLGLALDDLREPHAAEHRLAEQRIPADAKDVVAALRESIGRELSRLDGALVPAVVEGMHRQFEFRIQRLERRLRAAAKHREHETMRVISAVRGVVHPFGKRQDRVLNAVPLLCRYGDELIDVLREQIAAHARRIVAGSPVAV